MGTSVSREDFTVKGFYHLPTNMKSNENINVIQCKKKHKHLGNYSLLCHSYYFSTSGTKCELITLKLTQKLDLEKY